MNTHFVFTGMRAIFHQARRRDDPTIAFELTEGAGCFVFLFFFSPEDVGNATLFIYLPRVNKVLSLKIYGRLSDGQFGVYFRPDHIDDIKRELDLGGGNGKFDILDFLGRLNARIPQDLPLADKLKSLRQVWPRVGFELKEYIHESEKTVLIGIKHLPQSEKPRDKTLRKLYLFTNSDADAVEDFIQRLRQKNVTLVWTREPKDGQLTRRKTFAELMADI